MILFYDGRNKNWQPAYGKRRSSVPYITPKVLVDHPAFFRELKWWEERDIKELPKYVKTEGGSYYVTPGSVLEVETWTHDGSSFYFRGKGLTKFWLPVEDFVPATKEEYNKVNK